MSTIPQREIKFRVWDKVDNVMRYNIGLSLIGVQVYAQTENEQPPEEILLERGRDCFGIMQYTGLKDAKGKEIYEGDLMCYLPRYPKDFQESNPHKRYGRINNGVSWSDKWCCFMADSTYEKENIFLGFGENEQWEVIGNIYENPELLHSEK